LDLTQVSCVGAANEDVYLFFGRHGVS
jgi:hypothetical protein